MEGALSICGVSSFFLRDPYAKVNVDPEYKGLVPVVRINKIESLAKEVCSEGYPRVINLIWSVIQTRSSAVVSEDL